MEIQPTGGINAYPYLVAVAYDIASNKRRRNIVRFLEQYGQRVQESVFECRLNRRQMNQLTRGVPTLICEAEDTLRIYTLSDNSKVKVWGKNTSGDFLTIII